MSASRKPLTPFVESYKFWDIVTLWARDRLEHEEIVARVLSRAIICDGLKAQCVDPKWIKGVDKSVEFRGYPYVGYRASPGSDICILRAEALEHLLGIARKADNSDKNKLSDIYITREDFRDWACSQEMELPTFWFGTVVSKGL